MLMSVVWLLRDLRSVCIVCAFGCDQHAGAYGQSVEYCYTMVHKAPAFPGRLKDASGSH